MHSVPLSGTARTSNVEGVEVGALLGLQSGMSDIRLLNRFAARQYGCFNVGQVRLAGFDRRAVSRRIGNGQWIRMCPGVYAVASSSPSWERELSAAVLSRPRAIVGGGAAARLHGLKGFARARPVIVVPWSGNARSPISRVIRSSFFNTLETVRIRGFRTTTVAETVLAVAADLKGTRLEAVFEDALLTGRLKIEEFDPIFDRIVGARIRGAGRLRRLIEARQPEAFSVDSTYLERLLEGILGDPRLPPSTREYPMSIDGRASRVDAYLPAWRLVIEADSRRWHARQADFELDKLRDNSLAAEGIVVLRFTYQMLKNDPDVCLRTILRAGAHRRA